MMEFKLVMKCGFCGKKEKYVFNDEDKAKVLNAVINTNGEMHLCKECISVKEARIWLTNKIMED